MYLKRDLKINDNRQVIDFCYDHGIDLTQFTLLTRQIYNQGSVDFDEQIVLREITGVTFKQPEMLRQYVESYQSDHQYQNGFMYKLQCVFDGEK